MNGIYDNRFLSGLIWNYISTVILALSGFAFSFIILLYYDADVLGIFNLSYAYYIVFSQITVFGIHASILRDTSMHHNNSAIYRESFSSAVLVTACISTLISMILLCIIHLIPIRYVLREGICNILYALPLFSLNKVILGYVNGLSRMRAYAVLQGARNVFIICGIMIMVFMQAAGESITLAFLYAEAILFLMSISYLLWNKLIAPHVSVNKMKEHLVFGAKIIPANIVVELNTKVDVICLGMILGDETAVGIYSFANLFAEGFYQLLMVIRRSLNPRITSDFYSDRDRFDIKKKTILKYIYYLGIPAVMAAVAVYIGICLLMHRKTFIMGVYPMAIICVAIVLNARFIIMGNSLSQLGFPSQESLVNLISVIANVGFNIVLIHTLGLVGAAIATGISYCIYSLVLKHEAQRLLGYRI